MNRYLYALLCLPLLALGCADSGGNAADDIEIPTEFASAGDTAWRTVSELRSDLRANANAKFRRVGNEIVEVDLFKSGVEDITPLKGLPLRSLDLGFLPVEDLSPLDGMPLRSLTLEQDEDSEGPKIDDADLAMLKGMPLESLKMQFQDIENISSLADFKLKELNLYGTRVSDISTLKGMPLSSLWLRRTPVSDITALEGVKLVSLDLKETKVSDLNALKGMTSLKRLNIAETDVKDLTPLAGLELERLIFTRDNIDVGLEVVRAMTSIREIGESLEDSANMTFDGYWNEYDEVLAE